jgi:hypothetical protein
MGLDVAEAPRRAELVEECEWATPVALDEAILADRLGFVPEPEVCTALAQQSSPGSRASSSCPPTRSTSGLRGASGGDPGEAGRPPAG